MNKINVVVLLSLVAGCMATAEEEGDARLGFISVGANGDTSLTFNATSVQNAVILGLFIAVLGALILPLFGLTLGGLFGDDGSSGYGYDSPSAYASSAYEQPSASGYSGYSKRSLDMMGPIVENLSKAHKKYEE